jgi:predicted transcriptional regulator
MPAIIDFLGYDPLQAAKGWGERLVRYRTTLGMTQKAAGRLGVDQATLARWEQGKREPTGVFRARVKRFLQGGACFDARRAVYGRS